MSFKNINLSYLRTMASDDLLLQQQLLEMLLEDLDTNLPLLEKAIESADWSSVKQMAHHLKTTFPYTGNDFVLDLVKKIEQEALNETVISQNINRLFGDITLHLSAIKQELTQALHAIKNT